MDYSLILDLDNVTLDDCLNINNRRKLAITINDGRIINFDKEENNKYDYKSKET